MSNTIVRNDDVTAEKNPRTFITVRYSDEELEQFRAVILREKNNTLDELRMLKDRLEDLTSSDRAEDSMVYSMHMGEQGSEQIEKEKTYQQINRVNDYLLKLDDAIERINNKTYGVCKECGILIAKERLLAVPITTQSASYKFTNVVRRMALTVLSDVEKAAVIPNKRSRKMLWFFITAALLIILDQVTKILVKGFTLFGYHHDGMFLGESHALIGDIVRLTFVENPGMAFGIQFGFAKIFLTLFSLIAGSALVWYLSKLGRFALSIQIGITLLIAGALGNFIDRCFYGVLYGEQPLFYGYVVDFIQVDIPDIDWFGATYTHWPVFNVADSCVSIGMVLLLIFNKYLPTLADIRRAESGEHEEQELELVSSHASGDNQSIESSDENQKIT